MMTNLIGEVVCVLNNDGTLYYEGEIVAFEDGSVYVVPFSGPNRGLILEYTNRANIRVKNYYHSTEEFIPTSSSSEDDEDIPAKPDNPNDPSDHSKYNYE